MLELTLSNGKQILISGEHIVALVSGGTAGASVVLSTSMTYEVTESPRDVEAMIDAKRAG